MSDLTKDDLRQQAKRHRGALRPSLEDAEAACDLFFEAVKPSSDHVVALYWPMNNEFSTQLILERLMEEDITCVLPVMQKDSERVLRFARWRIGDPMQEGAFKVHEPVVTDTTEWATPDIILVPLLAFDRRGHRLGYGSGYYDATLDSLRQEHEVVSVGIAYDAQMVLFPLPADPHDQPLDLVITPQKVYRFEE